MRGLKYILFCVVLVAFASTGSAQVMVTGQVKDLDSQLVIGQTVEIYSDSAGVYYPYSDSALTGTDGTYSFWLPQNIPQGVVFRVKTAACSVSQTSGGFLYPFTSISCDFVICNTNKYISGHVFMGTTPADTAFVYLMSRNWDTSLNRYAVQKVDSLFLQPLSGFYNFKLPLTGNDSYYVKAAMFPVSSQYSNYLPAYHDAGALNWNNAQVLPKENAVADISMPSANVSGGQGYISGVVLDNQGDSLYKRILILTTINDVPVAFRYSNVDGTFSFGGLGYGTYKLFGDALGKQNPELVFVLSASGPSLTDLTFVETDYVFSGSLWPLSVSGPADDRLKVYPNPFTDILNISGIDSGDEVSVRIVDVTGRTLYNKLFTDQNTVSISTHELPSGLYFLTVSNSKSDYIYKISK